MPSSQPFTAEFPRRKIPAWLRNWAAAWIVLAVGSLLLIANARLTGRVIHGWDPQFYYAVALSLVCDGDLDISNDLPATPWSGAFDRDGDGELERLPRREDGRVVNKYPVGLSLYETPWLAAAVAGQMTGSKDDAATARQFGYTQASVIWVGLGNLIALVVGMQILYGLLQRMAPAPWALGATLATWWGTSLLYYSTIMPGMPHALAFTLLLAIVRLADAASRSLRPNLALVLMGVLAGCLFLVRPQQLVGAVLAALLLRPLLRRPLGEWAVGATCGLLAILAAIALQASINAANTGAWHASAYAAGGEHFRWLAPRFDVVLISSHRGLLWITPLTLLGALGLALNWRRVPNFGWVYVANFAAQVYLAASWSSPEAGSSFGHRFLCESLPAVAIGLALFSQSQAAVRKASVATAALCIVWTNLLLLVYCLRTPVIESGSYTEIAEAAASIPLRGRELP